MEQSILKEEEELANKKRHIFQWCNPTTKEFLRQGDLFCGSDVDFEKVKELLFEIADKCCCKEECLCRKYSISQSSKSSAGKSAVKIKLVCTCSNTLRNKSSEVSKKLKSSK
jgi:hypothetical protein